MTWNTVAEKVGTPFPVGPLAVNDGRAVVRAAVRAVAFRGGALLAAKFVKIVFRPKLM